jgi:DNA-binding Xre family transcriptional regulator
MKTMDIIKEIMEKKDIRAIDLAKRLGISAQALNGRFTQKNVSVDKLNDMLKMMDYRIVIVPNSTKLPNGGYEVE